MIEKELTQHVIDGMKKHQPKNFDLEIEGYWYGILMTLTDVAYFADRVDWMAVKEEAEKMHKSLPWAR